MTPRLIFVLLMLMNPVFAQETISFKKELTATGPWYPYVLVFLVLLVVLFILAHYLKKTPGTHSKSYILKRIAAHHKTSVYVIDYQGQQFLLAENQNALALHPLNEIKSHHEE